MTIAMTATIDAAKADSHHLLDDEGYGYTGVTVAQKREAAGTLWSGRGVFSGGASVAERVANGAYIANVAAGNRSNIFRLAQHVTP
jgi:hypothetical protein